MTPSMFTAQEARVPERAIGAAIRWAGLDLSGFHITPLQGVSHVLKAAAEIAELNQPKEYLNRG